MFSGKVLLITGGTGSFGQKFAESVLRKYRPKKVIVFSRDELKQYEMRQKLSIKRYPAIRYFIGDVRDRERLYRAMDGVNVVVHTAALKQVPTAEYNPIEAVKTNVLGAANVIDAAIDRNVNKVIALSIVNTCGRIDRREEDHVSLVGVGFNLTPFVQRKPEPIQHLEHILRLRSGKCLIGP